MERITYRIKRIMALILAAAMTLALIPSSGARLASASDQNDDVAEESCKAVNATSTDAADTDKSVKSKASLASADLLEADVGSTVYIGGKWYSWGGNYAGNYHVSASYSTAAGSGSWTGRDSYTDKNGLEGMRVFCGQASKNGFSGAAGEYEIDEASSQYAGIVTAWGNALWDADGSKNYGSGSNTYNYGWSGLDYREKIYRVHMALNYLNGGSGKSYYEAAMNWAQEQGVIGYDDAYIAISGGAANRTLTYTDTDSVEADGTITFPCGETTTVQSAGQYTSMKKVLGTTTEQCFRIVIPENVWIFICRKKGETWTVSKCTNKTVSLKAGDQFCFYKKNKDITAKDKTVIKGENGKSSIQAEYMGVKAWAFRPKVGGNKQTMYAAGVSVEYKTGFTIKWEKITNSHLRKTLTTSLENGTFDISDNANYNMAGIVYSVYYNGVYYNSSSLATAHGKASNGTDSTDVKRNIGARFVLSYDGRAYADGNGNPIVLYSKAEKNAYQENNTLKTQEITGLYNPDTPVTYTLVEARSLYCINTKATGGMGALSTTYENSPTEKYQASYSGKFAYNKTFSSSGAIRNTNDVSFKSNVESVAVSDPCESCSLKITKESNSINSNNSICMVAGAVYTVYWTGAVNVWHTTHYPVADITIQDDGMGKVTQVYDVAAGTSVFKATGLDTETLENLPIGHYDIVENADSVPDGFERSARMSIDFTNSGRTNTAAEGDYRITYSKNTESTVSDGTISLGFSCVLTDFENIEKSPLSITISKVDSENKTACEKSGATLENAVFMLEYFAGVSASSVTSFQSTAYKWYLKTTKDDDGNYTAEFDKEHLVNGTINGNVYRSAAAPSDISESTGNYLLEPGALRITEVTPSNGYLNVDEANGWFGCTYADGTEQTVRSGSIVLELSAETGSLVYAGNKPADDMIICYEQIIREDISFVKTQVNDDGSLTPMAGVVFEIKSSTTGEVHYVVTDKNGGYDSSTRTNGSNTNGNDAAYTADAYTENLSTDAGLWFTGESTGSIEGITVENGSGSLPYDTYTITEVRCAANRGYELADPQTVTISENGQNQPVELDYENVRYPMVASTVSDDYVLLSGSAVVYDTVELKYLRKDRTYTLKGIVMDKTTGRAAVDSDGNYITGESVFTGHVADGDESEAAMKGYVVSQIETVTFTMNSLKMDSDDTSAYVVYEYLYDGESTDAIQVGEDGLPVTDGVMTDDDGSLVAHEDITSSEQTFHIAAPMVDTAFLNTDTGMRTVAAYETAEVTDTVTYENLVSGGSYTLVTKLVNGETGNAIMLDGAELISSKTFTASSNQADGSKAVGGTVSASFTLDISELISQNESLTKIEAYQYIYEGTALSDNTPVGKHDELGDEDQTLTITTSSGSTRAEDSESGTQTAYPDENVTIIDHVSYVGLTAGEEYTITGTVIRKDTGKALDTEGATSTIRFTPTAADGTVDVTFTFDASALEGEQIVIFEACYRDDREVFVHEDLSDENQTISFPSIVTSASTAGGKYLKKGCENTVVDTITYTGFDTQETYAVRAELIDKGTREVVAASTAEFTPQTDSRFGSGSMDMSVTFDVPDDDSGSKKYVMFEYIYSANGSLISQHADINYEGQTVTVLYSPKTGDSFPVIPVIMFGTAFAGAAGVLTVKRSRRIKGNHKQI